MNLVMSLKIGVSLFLLAGLVAGPSVARAEENLAVEKGVDEVKIINRADLQGQPFLTGAFKVPESHADLLKDYQTRWERLTGFEFSGLHWRQFIVIYVNKNSEVYRRNYDEYVRLYVSGESDDDESRFEPYEEGTVFLKEHYLVENGSPTEPLTVTLMIKHAPGYDPQKGDWEYIQFDAAGKILMNGPSRNSKIWINCAECHANMAERDYIFSTYSVHAYKSEKQ